MDNSAKDRVLTERVLRNCKIRNPILGFQRGEILNREKNRKRTVGYGDVSPVTVLGKMMASVVMLTGFAIIAVPTGVVTAELGREMALARENGRRCGECGWLRHDTSARYCQQCGTRLP